MSTEGNNLKKTDRIEALRLLLEQEKSRAFTYDEATDIGESLVSFFELLAEDDPNKEDDFEGLGYGTAS